MRAPCRVVLTRTPPDNARLRAELEGLAAEVVDYPCVEIARLALLPVIAERVRDGLYASAFFVSPHAVECFFEQAQGPSPIEVIGLGAQTGRQLERHGWPPSAYPADARLGSVAACLDSLFQAQGRVLYVCGTLGDPQVVEALRVLGREVDVAVVYRNDSAARTRLPEGGHPTLLTFASPSAVRNFTESNLPLQPRWEALAIGPTTAEAARQAGFPVYQAAAPGVEALATAIHAWVNHQSLVT